MNGMMKSNRDAATEGLGKLLGYLFTFFMGKRWFRWFIKIFVLLIVLQVLKTVVLAFIKK